jgi:hypothetical protein
MSIVSTDEVYSVATQALVTNPDVGLDVLKHVT